MSSLHIYALAEILFLVTKKEYFDSPAMIRIAGPAIAFPNSHKS